jgi:hypothetical protein
LSEEKIFTTSPAPIVKDIGTSVVGVDFVLLNFTTISSRVAKIYYGTSTEFGGLETLNIFFPFSTIYPINPFPKSLSMTS